MGFKTLDDVLAYQVIREFKREVYRLVKSHSAAYRDLKFRDQLFDAVSSAEANCAEGFYRDSMAEFARFLKISRASLGEAVARVRDGIDREYFTEAECARAFELGDRAGRLTIGLIRSLEPFIRKPPPGSYRLHRANMSKEPPRDTFEEAETDDEPGPSSER
jgi:four helix bundle protein